MSQVIIKSEVGTGKTKELTEYLKFSNQYLDLLCYEMRGKIVLPNQKNIKFLKREKNMIRKINKYIESEYYNEFCKDVITFFLKLKYNIGCNIDHKDYKNSVTFFTSYHYYGLDLHYNQLKEEYKIKDLNNEEDKYKYNCLKSVFFTEYRHINQSPRFTASNNKIIILPPESVQLFIKYGGGILFNIIKELSMNVAIPIIEEFYNKPSFTICGKKKYKNK